ncbi:MAG TPA: ADOP family duplicated permease [Gemmatimonadaceae bacterium]
MLRFLRSVWFRISSRTRRDALDAELAEELRMHREFLEDEGRRSGLSADEARHVAALRLGNGTVIAERTRDFWSLGWLDAVLRDARYAGRFLRRSPGFTAVAVISLALGIGANAAVFSVVDRLLLRPPAHVTDPNNVYAVNVRRIRRTNEPRPFYNMMKFNEIFALKETATSFESVVPYFAPSRRRLGRGPDAPRIKEATVGVDFFRVLGVKPVLGRFFNESDARPDATERAAVISDAFWERHFARSESALGARLLLAGLEMTVIGVAPPGFTGVDIDAADAWTLLEAVAAQRIQPNWKEWEGYSPRAIVRLREGVAPATADAEATMIVRRLPDSQRSGPVEETVRLGSVLPGRAAGEQPAEVKVSTRLMIAAVLVTLAACANLANLLLVRALTRRREIALRLAVGISRRRLVGQLVLESLIIAALGAGAAVVAGRWGGAALRTLVFPQMQWATQPVDGRVLLFATVCAVIVALLATLAPAIRMTRADVALALRSASPQLAMSTGRVRQGLLAVQVALSVVLIVGAAAFGQSLRRAYEFDMGIDVNRLLVTRLFLEEDSLNPAGRRDMLDEALRRASRLPGVERTSIAEAVPLSGNSVMQVKVPRGDSGFTVAWTVTPDLQHTLGFRLLRGRWIEESDTRGNPVVIISETFARRMFPGTNGLGQCARFGADTSPCREVVGVIGDLRTRSIREEAPMAALLPTANPELRALAAYLVIRASGDLDALQPALHAVLRDVRSDLSTVEMRPLAQLLDTDFRPLKLGTTMFGVFALLAIVLAGVGLFGILAFSVAQRTSELGIRSALGAGAGNLVRLVVGEGLAIVGVGLALGGLASWFAGAAVQSLMFNTTVRSATPFVLAALTLAAAALCASAIPAWRAARVDPAIALRAE